MRTIADHLFDILENSVNASADRIVVKISFSKNIFYCQINDNGITTKLQNITDPFVTSRKTRRVGLGLPLLKVTTESTGGYLKISFPENKKGTRLEFAVNMKHIDARPFGDMAAVFSDIVRIWPDINIEVFVKQSNLERNILDTGQLKETLNVETLNDNEVISYVKENLKRELLSIGIDQQFGIT